MIPAAFPLALPGSPLSCLLPTLDSKHQSHRSLNQGHRLVIHRLDARKQSAFVDDANLFNSGASFGGECGQFNQQRPIGWGGRAGQRHYHDSASDGVQFGQGHNDARSAFGHFGALDWIESYPEYVSSLNKFTHLTVLDLRRAAWVSANSRSKVSRSKLGSRISTDSVNSAFTHSSVSRASSGYWASSSFIRAAAWAIMRFSASCFASKSCFIRSTMYRLRCRGGTARASFAATSSGRRSKTCLGGGV